MKKSLFFALFAIVTLAFVGCVDPVDPVDYAVTVSPSELTLELGQTEKLAAVVVPTSTNAVVWASDNEEVVTVNASGIVTAVGLGSANITATLAVTEGDATVGTVTAGTCVVNVTNDAALDNFAIGGYGLFGNPEMIPGTDTVLTLSDGDYECQLGYISVYVWDNNIVYVSGVGFSGKGYFFDAYTPVYWITAGDFAGYYIGNSSGFFVDTVPADVYAPYSATAGQLVDVDMYGDAWKAILNFSEEPTEEEINAAYELYYGSQVGTQLFQLDWSTGSQSYNLGNVSYAQINEDEDGAVVYDLKLEWYDDVNPGRFYGLLVNTTEDPETGDLYVESLVEPYDMRLIHKEYSNMPVEEEPAEAAALKPMKKNLYLGEKPALPIANTKVMYKK